MQREKLTKQKGNAKQDQVLKQLTDQQYSNLSLINLLCTLETIQFIIDKKDLQERKFAKHDPNGFGKRKSLQELEKQAGIQMMGFDASLQIYKVDYETYHLPDDFTREDLCNFLCSIQYSGLRKYVEKLAELFEFPFERFANQDWKEVEGIMQQTLNAKPFASEEEVFECVDFIGIAADCMQQIASDVKEKYLKNPEKVPILVENPRNSKTMVNLQKKYDERRENSKKGDDGTRKREKSDKMEEEA
jgi:hypothetical protein